MLILCKYMVNTLLIRIDTETTDILEECKKEFIKHHPEFKKIPISYNKIVFEAGNFYLKG